MAGSAGAAREGLRLRLAVAAEVSLQGADLGPDGGALRGRDELQGRCRGIGVPLREISELKQGVVHLYSIII